MNVIRLARAGGHKRPFYHIVVADSRSPRDGRFIERLGYYNPIAPQSEVYIQMDLERIKHWISVGAQLTERVNFLVKDFSKHGPRTKPAKRNINKSKPATAPAAEQTATEAAAE